MPCLRRVSFSPHSPTQGQASVEFLLSIIFLLLIIFGGFETVMLLYTYNAVGGAAKEGLRYAVVHGCGATSATCSGSCSPACADTGAANVSAVVKSYAQLSFHDISSMNVSVSYPDGGASSPDRVRVTVQYPYRPLLNLGWPTVTVDSAAEGRIIN